MGPLSHAPMQPCPRPERETQGRDGNVSVMDPANGRVTLHDVARELGMSVTQTSRALNDKWDVAEKTKERARAVAAELGYVPNLEARRLKTGSVRADAIGLVLPQSELHFSNAFFAELLSGLVATATAKQIEVRLTVGVAPANDFKNYEQALVWRQVDGFVLVRTEVDDPRIGFLAEADFPFVAFGRGCENPDFPFVDDVDHVMSPIVEHLVALGHRRIACIIEPARFSMSHHRFLSFENAVTDLGIPVDPDLVVEADFDEDSGYVAAQKLFQRTDRPTAIVAQNDLLALGVLGAARDAGIRVPDELSVTGFDDIMAGRYATPGLTTVRRSPRIVGETLCLQLLDLVNGTAEADPQVLLEGKIVVRDSTGPVR
ncbi:MAG: LacI family transcriptional regulator [Acidimicrobiaceae bacterium]|nr:LacI family transcriptional regulator [Acidimicrobiaceae bacterium]MXW75047.1 LacI family transcriptional regulator [Acidimicrobiaceae bacterium]MYA74223.1 LacI family transcriptional regulator [Acidimicrobiaceae bacterium]MYC42515.1 LacI family transcriptional regulator [Acidimicrobiaceae bacterium]MYD07570.1 LacI family transcriptional regulator [Acidimicrobiaceae bacterium]